MITVLKQDHKISVKGHANLSIHGRDIVCAAVSTAIIMTINQIEVFSKLDQIEYQIDEGYFMIKYSDDDIIIKIITNLEYTLDNLIKQYPKYIKSI